MSDEVKYTYSSVADMFRHVFKGGEDRKVYTPVKTKRDEALRSFVCRLEAACLATAGSALVFK